MADEIDDTGAMVDSLRSGDPDVREAAWNELLKTLIPRIERRIGRRLQNAPQKVRQRLDDIKSETLQLLVDSLHQLKPVMSVERYTLGIADNLCRRALDAGRDREQGEGGSRADGPADMATSLEPTGSMVLRARELRRAIRSGLQGFRTTAEEASLLPRSDAHVQSPILRFLAIDLAIQGRGRPGDLIAATDLPAHTVTRLRNAALQDLQDAIEPLVKHHASSVTSFRFEIRWADLSPGCPVSDHWTAWSIGCTQLDPPFSDRHVSHNPDFAVLKEVHEANCLDCGPLPEADPAQIEDWRKMAEGSIARSRTR